MVSCGIKRCPPTPFDINQLHLIVALSRQRPRVRVPSTPPFVFINIRRFSTYVFGFANPSANPSNKDG